MTLYRFDHMEPELARGLGLVPNTSHYPAFGYLPDCPAEGGDLWPLGGTYTGFPASAEPVTIISTSADDTAAGTGARTVSITGLDSNYAAATEVVTLAGLSASAATTTEFVRVFRANVLTVGSGATNAGNLSIRQETTTANVFLYMPAGDGLATVAAYTAPAGHTAAVRQVWATVGDVTGGASTAAAVLVALQVKVGSGPWLRAARYWIPNGSPVVIPVNGPLAIPATANVKWTALESTVATAGVGLGAGIIERAMD